MSTLLPRSGGLVHTAAPAIEVLGMTMRVTTRDIGASGWSLLAWTVPPYCAGLPLHWHQRTEKVCYVLSGTLAFTLDQQMFTLRENDCLMIPPGARHYFYNPAAAPAVLLMWCVPGGIEHAIEAMLDRAATAPRLEQYDYFCDPNNE